MKYFILYFFIITCPFIGYNQINHDYVWLNGTDGTVSDPTNPNPKFGINMLDFNNGELNITRDYRDSDFYLMDASISSADGELLFYTNGCNVFQASGEIMENGTGINPGLAYDIGHCPNHGHPVSNGALILPFPQSDSLFYIFHKALDLGDGVTLGVYDGLVYSTVVDMSKNGGFGACIFGK